MIAKHLATFNVFREADGLYITVADARGVMDEIRGSGAPPHLCAMNALRSALSQMDARQAQVDRSAKRQDPKGLDPEDESAVPERNAP